MSDYSTDSDYDTEFITSDHVMVRKAVQTAVRNYLNAPTGKPTRMLLSIDFTGDAPQPKAQTIAHYQKPLIELKVDSLSVQPIKKSTMPSELPLHSL
ncbi:hypothetical protein AB6A40_005793 [Gnathostoma spinigerum]|uniref:Uncharacterized protein n=1 Tax=Gnathostoma spinigerum TaxID=75299 RepID=A0ABD6EP55_9BILA